MLFKNQLEVMRNVADQNEAYTTDMSVAVQVEDRNHFGLVTVLISKNV